MLKPESKTVLTGILTYHVVAGRYSAKDLMKLVKEGNGSATLKTVAGGTLTVTMKGNKVVVKDDSGGTAVVTIKDVTQSSGVIHVVDHVLLPKM